MEPAGDAQLHPRRINTEVYEDNPTNVQDLNDEEDDVVVDQVERLPRRSNKMADRRKYIDTTTPTLEDEDLIAIVAEEDEDDQEEEEMISLEQERLRRVAVANRLGIGESGRQVSLRRTPGASQMHQSRRLSNVGEEELLGFGLALTTPVAAGKKEVPRASPSMRRSPSASASSSRPPRDPASSRQAYTPASFALTKNPHLQVSHGSFSPNTLRLTEDLDNLLDEEEDQQQLFRVPKSAPSPSAKHAGDDQTLGEEGDSWTAPYIFESEGGTGEMCRMSGNKGQRNRRTSGRRSRNSDSPHLTRQQLLVTAAQPKPVRSKGALNPSQKDFTNSTAAPTRRTPTGNFARSALYDDEVSQPLNFGGAFAPPTKAHVGTFQRPVPSSAPEVHEPTFHSYNEKSLISGVAAMQNVPEAFNPPAFAPHHAAHAMPYPSPPVLYNPVDVQRHQMAECNRPRSSFAPPSYMLAPAGVHPQWPTIMLPPPTQTWQASPWDAAASLNYGNHHRIPSSPHQMPPLPPPSYQHAQHFWQPAYASSSSLSHFLMDRPDLVDMQEFPDPTGDDARQQHPFDETASRTNRKPIRRNEKKPRDSKPSKMDKVSRNKKTSAVSRPKGSKAEECENPEDAKRAALVETPETRTAFKEFYRVFRLKERTSVKEAEEFAVASLHNGSVPEKSFWRVYLELADLAKRSNRFEEARRLFILVCELQPYASQTWLEFSKLEEECGHMSRCARILHTGLQYCEMNENLLSRAIKHEEKMNNLARARELLARLKHVGIEKAWRTVLEGALLEGRAGNHATARRVLKYLMHHVPWYGPLYLEAYKLERELGRHSEALNIVEKGLNAIPRYGPLWFAAFRLCETIDLSEQKYHLPRTVLMFERAATAISRELVWKVHLEASQIFERAALASMEDNQDGTSGLNLCRTKIGMTTLSCPSNLSWKVWLAGGRMELSSGNIETARRLFLRAHEVVPSKGRVATLLECARLEEYVGDVELARSILCKSRIDLGSEWKIWLESVLLEIRDNEKERALALAKQSTKAHPGTGRLWASLVQLRAIEGGDDAQYESLKQALKAVPKSGEVWCEGGRIHLNPFSKRFNLNEARRHLLFATRFTPQYGDGFLETIRLEIIELWLLPMASFVWEAVQPIVCSEESNPEVWVASVVVAAVKVILAAANNTAYSEFEEESLNKSVLPSLRAQLEFPSLDELLENSDLELRCANADPNYGSMWFNCRSGPTDTARVVLRCARYQIFADLKKHAHIYVGAMIRQLALAATGKQYGQENADESQIKLLAVSEGHAVKAPSLESILQSQKAEDWTDNVLLERALSGCHFSSGLVALNEHKPLQKLSLLERKKALFGSDSLFS